MRLRSPYLGLFGILALCACQRDSATTGKEAAAPAPSASPGTEATVPSGPPEEGLKLSADEATKLGIVLASAQAASFLGEVDGYGTVMSREVIAQALTDRVTAQAAARQSRAALERVQRLAGGAGADSATVREAAERQAAADAAALDLAEAKASSVLGQGSPWQATGESSFKSVREGRMRLVKLSFPLGSFRHANPRQARVSRLDALPSDGALPVASIWAAPADPGLPGRSFFALVDGADLAEGEHLLAWGIDPALPGIRVGAFIPASALVVSDAQYWCYVATPRGVFVRTRIDISRPQPGGYFIAAGIKPGDRIVTTGAGLLLARESNAAGDADP